MRRGKNGAGSGQDVWPWRVDEGRRRGEAGELVHHGAEVGGVGGENGGGLPARRPGALPRLLVLGRAGRGR
jgi:hypothetical protein